MAMTAWSTTAANNVLANTGINMDEGMAPSALNDSIREIMAVLKTAIDTGNMTATGTTFNLINTVATTVNFAGAASVALNIGHASAPAVFAGGVTVASGKTLTLTGATVAGQPTWSSAQTIPGIVLSGNITESGARAITITGALSAGAISGTTGTFSGSIAANAGLVIAAGQTLVSRDLRSDTGQALNLSAIGAAALALWTNSSSRLSISSVGAVTISNLAGTGTRTVVVDANGVLSAP